MRALPAAMAQMLEAGASTLARCWRLVRADGFVVGCTEHDADLLVAGTLHRAARPVDTGTRDQEAGLSAGSASLSGVFDVEAVTGEDLLAGRWDGAVCELRVADWTDPSRHVLVFTGRVSAVTRQGSGFELDIEGPAAALSRTIGRTLHRLCGADLGDARCGVDMTAASLSGVATVAGFDQSNAVRVATLAGLPRARLAQGRLRGLTGVLAGWSAAIEEVEAAAGDGWIVKLAEPVPLAPSEGDAVRLDVGCDKRFSTCADVFGNAANFRGCPLLPGDDAVFAGPAVSGNDGGRR